MTRLELIKIIGDLITSIDVVRGSLMPGTPRRRELDDLRIRLDDRQRQLTQKHFDDNTLAFQKAAAELEKINAEIGATLGSVSNLAQTINDVERMIGAVDTILAAVPLA